METQHQCTTKENLINRSLNNDLFLNACNALNQMLPPRSPNLPLKWMDIEKLKYENFQW